VSDPTKNKGGRPITVGKGATVTLTVRLTLEHRVRLDAIRDERGHASVSETLRALIEGA